MGDLFYLLLIILLTIIPQLWVRSTYDKYASIKINSTKTGEEVAREMLARNGINGININRIPGELTDHYHPRRKEINLSYSNFDEPTIASIAVAAHETGHAIQDHKGYFFLRLRQVMGTPAIVASNLSWVFVYLGFILYFTPFIWLGIIMLGIVVLFDLVTLPVEINASKRAKAYLVSTGRYSSQEIEGVSKVLTAAAFTYIAVTLAGVLQLIRLLNRVRRD